MGGAILTPTFTLWGAGRLRVDDGLFLLALSVAAIGGGLGWLLYTWERRLPLASFVCGALMGAGGVFAIMIYKAARMNRLEVYLLCLAGAAPGLGLYWLLQRGVPASPPDDA